MAVQAWWRSKVAEVKRAFRSVQTPSAPSAEEQHDDEEEEVISTFGGFLMKSDSEGIPGPSTNNRSESEGGGAGGRAGRRGHGRGAAVARLLNTSGDQPLMQVK